MHLSCSRLHSCRNCLRLLHHRHSTLHPKTHETSATESSSRLVLKNTDNFTSQFSLKNVSNRLCFVCLEQQRRAEPIFCYAHLFRTLDNSNERRGMSRSSRDLPDGQQVSPIMFSPLHLDRPRRGQPNHYTDSDSRSHLLTCTATDPNLNDLLLV